MDKNPIGELMQNTMESVKNMLKVDTVVGDPIFTPDGITLVPISRIPIGFLVIKEGVVRMINVAPPASNTVDRIIDLVPQVMDRVDAFIEKQKS